MKRVFLMAVMIGLSLAAYSFSFEEAGKKLDSLFDKKEKTEETKESEKNKETEKTKKSFREQISSAGNEAAEFFYSLSESIDRNGIPVLNEFQKFINKLPDGIDRDEDGKEIRWYGPFHSAIVNGKKTGVSFNSEWTFEEIAEHNANPDRSYTIKRVFIDGTPEDWAKLSKTCALDETGWPVGFTKSSKILVKGVNY